MNGTENSAVRPRAGGRAAGSRRWLSAGALALAAGLALGTPSHAAAAFGSGTPAFANYTDPIAGQSAGEPSIGVDWATGAVMFQAVQHTDKVIFDDSTSPATAQWTNVTAPTAVTSLDPILFVDPNTNRTFESQLVVACSLSEFSDNDGTSWTPDQGCGPQGAEDHQTVGGGHFHSPVPAPPTYPDAVYYCSQDFANGTAAFCSLSVTGGATFLAPAVVYNTMQCGGLHGHIRVAPDGTAYLPNQGCSALSDGVYTHQAAAISTTNGQGTWTLSPIPDSRPTFYSDPSVAVGSAGTVYFGYENGGTTLTAGGGHPMIAVSTPGGLNWAPSVDVGTTLTLANGSTVPLGIQNTAFPEVIAGDDNRAAFAFLGSTTGGNYQLSTFAGSWDLYVSLTYDGGAHWTTVDATPNNPVQRGCIWLQGGSNQCRNLLDFNDISVDKQGRVVVAYAKGCNGACITDPSQPTFNAVGTIARQTGGQGLFAVSGAGIPEVPSVTALLAAGGLAAVIEPVRRRLRGRAGRRR